MMKKLSQTFDSEITSFEKEFAEILGQMEKAKQSFVAGTIEFLTKWFQNQARYHVEEQYEHTHSLGLTRLTELKQKVGQLIKSTPMAVARLVGHDSLWWHRSRRGGWKDQYSSEPPEGLTQAMRLLAGAIAPILEAYGYLKKDPDSRDTWREWDEKNDCRPSNARPYYPHQLEWSDKMTTAIEGYMKHLGRATFLDSKVSGTQKLKKKMEAGNLWDKA